MISSTTQVYSGHSPMQHLRQQVNMQLQQAIMQALGAADVDPVLQEASRPEYGDFQANFALKLAKQRGVPPRELAAPVVKQLLASAMFSHAEVSGPGFINVRLHDDFIAEALAAMHHEPKFGLDGANHAETVVVDYAGANVAKAMHVGHLRSIVLGDAMCRILAFVGHKVIRQNHLGDWGTQFGMLIEYVLASGQDVAALATLEDLNHLYRAAKARFDEDAAFADAARARVVLLQSGDVATRKIWQHMVDISVTRFQQMYQRLGTLLTVDDNCGESFYQNGLSDVVGQLRALKLALEDAGAVIAPTDGATPLIIQKADGGYLYATTDLAAIKHRVQHLQATRIIYVTDVRQQQHFAQVFAVAAQAGWSQEAQLQHAPFGAVLGEDGQPFKTRSGEVVPLEQLLDEAEQRARDLLHAKNPELGADGEAIAKAVAIGAIKFADLVNEQHKDYVFAWGRMLSLQGSSAPYLQNAYVRICALFRQLDTSPEAWQPCPLILSTDIEHQLAVSLLRFPEVVLEVAESLQLHRLCRYLLLLATKFHDFYEQCRILVPEEDTKNSRLSLAQAVARVLATGLNLLGIQVVRRM